MPRVALLLPFAVVVGIGAVVAFIRPHETRTVSANGVEMQVPAGWGRIQSAGDAGVVDPVTVLVVGTHGAGPTSSACQIAHYRVPPLGAIVVVVRWRSETSGGGRPPRSRGPLEDIELNRHGFECRPGSLGGAAQVALGGHAYQVNVLIGDRAPRARVAEALSVARSFDLAT